MEQKEQKQAALYIYRPNTQYQCKDCVFFHHPVQCALYANTALVDPNGSCNFFIQSDKLQGLMPFLDQPLNKEETGYHEPEPEGYSCKRCEYFDGVSDCKKVDKDSPGNTIGVIYPDACCNLWEKKDK